MHAGQEKTGPFVGASPFAPDPVPFSAKHLRRLSWVFVLSGPQPPASWCLSPNPLRRWCLERYRALVQAVHLKVLYRCTSLCLLVVPVCPSLSQLVYKPTPVSLLGGTRWYKSVQTGPQKVVQRGAKSCAVCTTLRALKTRHKCDCRHRRIYACRGPRCPGTPPVGFVRTSTDKLRRTLPHAHAGQLSSPGGAISLTWAARHVQGVSQVLATCPSL